MREMELWLQLHSILASYLFKLEPGSSTIRISQYQHGTWKATMHVNSVAIEYSRIANVDWYQEIEKWPLAHTVATLTGIQVQHTRGPWSHFI